MFKKCIQIIFTWIKDSLFPVFCLGCNAEGVLLCLSCSKNIVYAPDILLLDDSLVFTTTEYHEQTLCGKLLHAGKYLYMEDAFEYLRPLIQYILVEHKALFKDVTHVCAIPLHRQRFAERGFNQSDYIAHIIATELDILQIFCLKRVKKTKQQARLSKEERIENTKDAFVCIESKVPVSGHVLVVDDVFTTGSTMQAAIDAFKAHNRLEISGFTVARG
jgi:ComF family protein